MKKKSKKTMKMNNQKMIENRYPQQQLQIKQQN